MDKLRLARMALLYAGLGGLALLIYEGLARLVFPPESLGPTAQILGAALFLAVTTALIYALLLRSGRQTERKRREAEEIVSATVACAPLAILTIDTDRILRSWNEAAERIFGWTAEEAIGKPLPIVPDDKQHEFAALCARLIGGEVLSGVELSRRRKDGSSLDVRLSAAALRDGKGKVFGILSIIEDHSAQVAAQASFRRAQALLHMASRVSRTGAWVVDLAGPSILWSEEVRTLHEAPADFSPTPENNLSFYAPEHRGTIEAAFGACIREGEPFDEELEIITAKGRRIWVRTMGEPVRDDGGTIVGVQGALQDISAHKDAERSLHQSQLRFRQLADAMPLIVWTAEPNGRMDYVSQAFTAYTGIAFAPQRVERWMHTLHPEDLERCKAAWKAAVLEERPCEIEFRLRRRSDGSHRWHLLGAVPIRDEGGRIIKWYGTATDIHESKQAEEKANRLAQEITTTLESITDAFFTLDREWRLTYVNTEGERLLQFPRNELLGEIFWEKFPGTVGTTIEAEYRQAMETGKACHFETFYAPRNMWLSVRVYPSQVGIAIYFADITHRQKVREALRESRRRLAGLLDNFPGIAYRRALDPEWTTLFVSEGAEALTGYSPGDLLKNVRASYAQMIDAGDRERVFREMREAAEERRPFELEYRIRARNGEEKRVWERGRFLPEDGGGHLEGFIMDVTARKRAEAERERLMAAVEQMGEIILITDTAGTIQYVNSAFERVTGYSRQEAVGRNPRILKSDAHDAAFFRNMFETLEAGRTYRGRMVNLRKDGTRFTEDSIISPVFDSHGAVVNYVCVKNDVTEQLVLEEQYRQAQKMEAVGRLAGGVAHDFNNMLTVILLRTELALRRTDPAETMHGFLKEIQDSANRSADLTRQLLAYARQQPAQPRVVALNTAVEGTLQILRRLIGEDIELAWVPGKNLWQVKVDPVQIDQIVANLCVNARDAIKDVGSVTIETKNIVFDEEYCRTYAGFSPGEYVMLSVSDNGRGMDRETQAHIFEPFFTTKEVGKGTGLGLATVYGIVKQNKGFINVYSEPGDGTSFRIYLPRHAGAEAADGAPARTEAPRANGEKVLLVEDEPMILEATAEILRGLGYTVLEAGKPALALEIAEDHPDEIHLILTDVVMPEMNGRDLVEKLQERRPGMKRVFMSGYTASVIMHRGIAGSEEHFIQKPFSTTDLAVTVRAALDSKDA